MGRSPSGSALAYLVAFGSLVGFLAYTYALNHLPVSLVSLYAYINPIVAVALGTLLLSEPLTIRIVTAVAVINTGVAFVKLGEPKRIKVSRAFTNRRSVWAGVY